MLLSFSSSLAAVSHNALSLTSIQQCAALSKDITLTNTSNRVKRQDKIDSRQNLQTHFMSPLKTSEQLPMTFVKRLSQSILWGCWSQGDGLNYKLTLLLFFPEVKCLFPHSKCKCYGSGSLFTRYKSGLASLFHVPSKHLSSWCQQQREHNLGSDWLAGSAPEAHAC